VSEQGRLILLFLIVRAIDMAPKSTILFVSTVFGQEIKTKHEAVKFENT
jgi:hypothetical protein